MSADDILALLEDADHYSGKYFFVPPRARWCEPWAEHVNGEPLLHPALKHVTETLVGCNADRARGARAAAGKAVCLAEWRRYRWLRLLGKADSGVDRVKCKQEDKRYR